MTRLTDEQLAAFKAAVSGGASRREALEQVGATMAQYQLASLPGGPLHGFRVGRRWRPPSSDPTPAEIRRRAAEVRLRWTTERWLGGELLEVGPGGRR